MIFIAGLVLFVGGTIATQTATGGACQPPFGDGRTPLYAYGWPLRYSTPNGCEGLGELSEINFVVDVAIWWGIAAILVLVAAIARTRA